MSKNILPANLKVFPQMLGRWQGSRLLIDAQGRLTGSSTIAVEARFADDRWQQTNTITEDGKASVALIAAQFDEAGVFLLETERVIGTGREVGGSIVVAWRMKDDPHSSFEELISFITPRRRARTWHHFRDGVLAGITLLQEERVD